MTPGPPSWRLPAMVQFTSIDPAIDCADCAGLRVGVIGVETAIRRRQARRRPTDRAPPLPLDRLPLSVQPIRTRSLPALEMAPPATW